MWCGVMRCGGGWCDEVRCGVMRCGVVFGSVSRLYPFLLSPTQRESSLSPTLVSGCTEQRIPSLVWKQSSRCSVTLTA